MNIDAAHLDTKAIASYTHAAAKPQTLVDFLMSLVPSSIVDALARNDILQILVLAALLGVALSRMGARGCRWSNSWMPRRMACSPSPA